MAALTIVGTPAWAATSAATSAASVVLPDGDWADVPATAVSPPGYTDRLIDGGALKPLALESDALTASGTGRPRSLAVEASGSFLSPNSDAAIPLAFRDRKTADVGVSVSGRYDAGNYGILGIDGTLRYGNFSSGLTFQSAGDGIAAGNDRVVGGSLTLRDEHLPLGGTWEMDSLAGVVPRSFLSLSRAQARFYLPTSSLLGASAVWRSDTIGTGRTTAEPRLSFNASVGEPGLSGGFRLPEFVGLGGIEADAGVQWRPRPGIVGGFQAIIARNTRDTIATVFDTGGVPRISGEGLYAAIGAGGTNWRVQVNALHSETRQSGVPLVQAD